MKRLWFLCWSLWGAVLGAETIYFKALDLFIDPPQDWKFTQDIRPDHWVMADPQDRVFLEYYGFEKAPVDQVLLELKQSTLKAQGPELVFDWTGGPAALGNWTFHTDQAGGLDLAGWALALAWPDHTGVLLAYTREKDLEHTSDTLLSVLNSIARGEGGRRDLGPLSAFFLATGKPGNKRSLDLPGLGIRKFSLGQDQADSQRLVVDRESRILKPFVGKPSMLPAWQRFYRQIFREFYPSLRDLAALWQDQVKTLPRDQWPARLLKQLQTMTYLRPGGDTDLLTVWEALAQFQGDCDTRALIYNGMLEALGFPSILMVSQVYSHGMAALDIPGPGARFPWEGKNYLVAELTAAVDLGQISADKADPAHWIGVEFFPKP